MSTPYVPIDCGLHDELQLRVLRGRPVALSWREGANRVVHRSTRLVDVTSRDAAEYVRLDDGSEIRLDRLIDVDGLRFDASCDR